MASTSFILILHLVATVVYINCSPQNDNIDDLIITTKPDNYGDFEYELDELVKKSQDFILKTNVRLENFELTEGNEENCWTTTTVETPYKIKNNVTDEYDYVVQTSILEQKIRVTKCRTLGAPCFGSVVGQSVANIDIFSIEASCEQKYGSVSLYVYDKEIHKIRYKMFEVPSCCACKLRSSSGIDNYYK